MRDARTARAWILAALALQLAGLVFDGVWHGLLHPGVEPTTFGDMVVHLATVHVLIYLGVLCALVTTGWALLERRRGSAAAVAGALLAVLGESWHAAIHLRLSTRGGPLAEGVALVGFAIVAAAVWMGARQDRRRLQATSSEARRAA
jgi:hypothetical protein